MTVHRTSRPALALALAALPLALASPTADALVRPVPVPLPGPDTTGLLLEVLEQLQEIQDYLRPASVTLSSGLFSLPSEAVSVDWTIINNDATPQTVTITVYKSLTGGSKVELGPGPITATLLPGHAYHNANTVGTVFQSGSTYEVVVTGGSPRVLPTVMVWKDMGNTVIPGTSIPPGAWARID